MTNLAEFLLARIAEDERVAEQSETHGTGKFSSPHWQRLTNGPGQTPLMLAARLRAECESKRRIVERVSDVRWSTYAVRDEVLGLLALPYADHPDCRAEWLPGRVVWNPMSQQYEPAREVEQ